MNEIPQTTMIHCQDPEKRRDIVVSDTEQFMHAECCFDLLDVDSFAAFTDRRLDQNERVKSPLKTCWDDDPHISMESNI